MSSPTQRSLKVMRERGYLTEVVERWIPGANIRKDLFGFIDILAIAPLSTVEGDLVVAVQSTSGSNVAARIKKITEHENLAAVRKAGIRILVHGWTKRRKRLKSGKLAKRAMEWQLREVDVS